MINLIKVILLLILSLLTNNLFADEKLIKSLIEQSATKPDAFYQLGELYLRGEKFPQDRKEAFKWFKKGADVGHASCIYELAVMYQEGKAVKLDLGKAFRLYERAANLGLKKAQYNTAMFYLYFKDIVKQDIKLGIKYLEKSASRGEVVALTKLGHFYERGEFVDSNINKAVDFYEKAIEKDSYLAQFYLGVIYVEGHKGIKRDVIKGVSLIEKSANQGFINAIFFMGDNSFNGIIIKKDLIKAKIWYKLAANRGYPWGIKMLKKVEEALKNNSNKTEQ